jgi:predicted lipoprotein with Yx(FWY)xxD motif
VKSSTITSRPVWIPSVATLIALSACAKNAAPSSGGGSSSSAQPGSVVIGTKLVPGAGTVLVDSNGLTLYELASESGGTIMCTSSCATEWPPLLLPAGVSSATAGSGVSASKLGTISRPDGGTQVTYGGMPLYLFVSDQSPGQDTGQGVEGFHVATPSGSGSTSGSGAGSTSGASGSSGGRYGYGSG